MKASRVVFLVFLIAISLCLVNTQPVKPQSSGTIYIRADGSVDPSTAPIQRVGDVYTFTDNIYDFIVVEKDNIVVDGAGYTLQGTGAEDSRGIYLNERSNVTIKNVRTRNFEYGLHLYESSNNTISGNNITENLWAGIELTLSSNNKVFANYIANNDNGIMLQNSINNTLSGNNITNNKKGIWLYDSSNNVLRNNSMVDNEQNFIVSGPEPSYFIHDVDTSNTVNGKPMYYWINRRNMEVPSDAGYVTLANCTGVTVQNLNLANGQGVTLFYTTNSRVTQNIITNNDIGVLLYESSNNTVSGNNITNNGHGIWLYGSSNNIMENYIANNDNGIYFGGPVPIRWCSNNTIYHNSFINNTKQVNDIHREEPFSFPSTNVWDNGVEGNHWSDYKDRYPNATQMDGSGVWDTPYVIDDNNQDNYPLMNPVVNPEFPDDEKPTTPTTEPFPTTWIVAAIAIIAVAGAALLVFFRKIRKKAGKAEE